MSRAARINQLMADAQALATPEPTLYLINQAEYVLRSLLQEDPVQFTFILAGANVEPQFYGSAWASRMNGERTCERPHVANWEGLPIFSDSHREAQDRFLDPDVIMFGTNAGPLKVYAYLISRPAMMIDVCKVGQHNRQAGTKN